MFTHDIAAVTSGSKDITVEPSRLNTNRLSPAAGRLLQAPIGYEHVSLKLQIGPPIVLISFLRDA